MLLLSITLWALAGEYIDSWNRTSLNDDEITKNQAIRMIHGELSDIEIGYKYLLEHPNMIDTTLQLANEILKRYPKVENPTDARILLDAAAGCFQYDSSACALVLGSAISLKLGKWNFNDMTARETGFLWSICYLIRLIELQRTLTKVDVVRYMPRLDLSKYLFAAVFIYDGIDMLGVTGAEEIKQAFAAIDARKLRALRSGELFALDLRRIKEVESSDSVRVAAQSSLQVPTVGILLRVDVFYLFSSMVLFAIVAYEWIMVRWIHRHGNGNFAPWVGYVSQEIQPALWGRLFQAIYLWIPTLSIVLTTFLFSMYPLSRHFGWQYSDYITFVFLLILAGLSSMMTGNIVHIVRTSSISD